MHTLTARLHSPQKLSVSKTLTPQDWLSHDSPAYVMHTLIARLHSPQELSVSETLTSQDWLSHDSPALPRIRISATTISRESNPSTTDGG